MIMEDGFQEKRLEQILKLDAGALLATIRDLEQKLSSYQRYDRPPAWFSALDQRLEQIEKWQQSFPDTSPSSAAAMNAVNSSSTHQVREVDGLSSREVTIDSPSSVLQGEQMLSLLEQKILSKVKTDLALKMENISLQFQDQLLNNSLEMDRLQKLLIIRPTTSELQQIILNVQTVEENTSKQIQSIYHTLQSKIKDSVSNEMISLLNELKSHQQHSNDKMDSISKLMNSYALELQELQKNEQKTFRLFEDIFSAQQKERQQHEQQLQSLLSDELQQKFDSSQSIVEKHGQELKKLQEGVLEIKDKFQFQFSFLDEKTTNESLKLRNELHDINDSILTTSNQLNTVEGDLYSLKDNYRRETNDWKLYRETLDDLLLQQKLSIKEIQGSLKDIQNLELFTRIPKCEESLAKLGQEVHNLQSTLTTVMNQDLKGLSERCVTLEERVNTVLPKLIQSESIRVTAAIKDIETIISNQAIFATRLNDDEELINNLLPLQQKMKTLNEKVDRFENEVFSFKSLVESSIDANTEIIRRIEDMEEKFDSLDEMINHRMNGIRDTLMETLLEKQYETTNLVKNMKDNIEIMSTAGESVPSSGPLATAKLSRMASNAGKNFLTEDKDSGSTPVLRGAVTSVVAMPKRQHSYRRPTISGAVVQGASMSGVGPGDHGIGSNALPPTSESRGVPMSDSFSNGNSPRTLSGEDNNSLSSLRGVPLTSNKFSQKNSLPPTGQFMGNKENPNRLSKLTSTRAIAEMTQPEQEDTVLEQSSPFDDEVFHHFMGNYNPTPQQMQSKQQENFLDTGSVATQLSDTPSQSTLRDDRERAVEGNVSFQPASAANKQVGKAFLNKSSQNHPKAQSTFTPSSSSALASFNGRPSAASMAPISRLSPQNRSELMSLEYGKLLADGSNSENVPNFREIQLLADLCLNYEDISMKKKRLSTLPPILGQTVIDIAQKLAEHIADSSDFDMVEMVLTKIMDENVSNLSEIQYDETFVIHRRQHKCAQILSQMSQLISHYYQQQHQPAIVQSGVVRTDARQLFFTLVRKALDLFLTKHNQILVVGNSRLGRIKIPTCIACDRPLIEKSRLEGGQSPTNSRAASPTNNGLWALENEFSAVDEYRGSSSLAIGFGENSNSQVFPSVFQENSVVTTTTTTVAKSALRLQSARASSARQGKFLNSTKSPFSGYHSSGNISEGRPKTSAGSRNSTAADQAYVMKAGFKMPHRPNSSYIDSQQTSTTPTVLPNMF